MAYSHYERLSALDATFLEIESPSVHMHVGCVAIVSGDARDGSAGPLDIDRIRALAEPALHRHPRFRQRLAEIPGFRHPVWVDDPSFRLDYHLRHTALPEPGSERQLKRLAGRIFSQKLDRHRPLWELWFVEGLAGGRFAVISKIHHCMVDGIAGAGLLAAFMAPEGQAVTSAPRWIPRPAPSGRQLFGDEIGRRLALPARVASAGMRLVREPLHAVAEARDSLAAVTHLFQAGASSASSTPLNDEIGPYRRFDWLRTDLATVKEARERLGGTVNDVVLAVVAGAMRRFLRRRGLAVDALDFRAMVPMSVRRRDQRAKLGNRVVTLAARLPVDEPERAERFRRVVEETERVKASDLAAGGELLEGLSDAVLTGLMPGLSRLAARVRAFNLVVTNVPGPQVPLELLGARLEAIYPLVPLFSNQALGIALFSYDGALFWGFSADWDAVPDLHELVDFVREELEAVAKLTGAA
ncbi:MAG: wax ester/triacylglycerol synthase family O-acyltransferase [Sorangiineae bacterium]|nr:wax ester/triacylglycerol synthase family O-acyltransferase [Sorangiineae bacterium]